VKKLGIGLFVILILLVGAILVAPGFVDWNTYKDRIAAEARKATGRDLIIDGDIGLALLPAPALSVENVRLANAPGGSDPTMVALRALKVRVAVLPLLQGRIQVDRVELVEPTILVEVLPDGRGNWVFADESGSASPPPETGGESGTPGQIALESVTISDGTLIYRDAGAGREERIDNLNALVAAESLKGPFSANGEADARGVRVAFEVNAGRLPHEGASPLALILRLPEAGAVLQLNGALSSHPNGTSLRGRFKASGDDLAALARALAIGAVPPMFAKPFTLESELSLSAQSLTAADVAFRQGDMSIDGAVHVTPGTPLDVRIRLDTQRIDLDKVLAESAAAMSNETAADTPAAPSQAGGAPAPEPAVPGRPAIPKDVTGSLQVAVDALIFRGQVIRQILVNVDVAEGQAKLSQGIALLPGGSDVSLTGTLAAVEPGGPPRFAGSIEVASDNLRAVLEWLGVDMAAVPADRLRRMTMTGALEATPDRLTLADMDLRVDVSRATGGIAVALRDRPAFGIGLAVDKLNVDAYLPADVPAGGPIPTAPAAPSGTGGQGAAPPNGLAFLDAVDANLDLRLGSVSARGIAARDVRLDATLQRGTLVLREASVGDVAGSSMHVSGAAAGLSTAPTFDGKAQIKIPEPVRLAKMLGTDSTAFTRLGAFEVGGTLKGSSKDVAMDMKASAAGGWLGVAGSVQPLAAVPSFDVAVTAAHPSLAQLAGALSPGVRLAPDLGGLDLKARLAGTAERFAVQDLSGQIGPTEVSGSLGADLTGPRPKITADLVTSVTPLAGLLAPAAAGQSGAAGAGASGGAGNAKSGRWSTQPIDVSALRAVDAEVTLRAQALVTDSLRLDTANVEATLTDGVLDLRKLTGTFYDGALSVSGKISAGGGLQAGLAVTAIELNVGRLLQDMAESDRVSGPLNLNASLTTQGKSEADLISTLAGTGDLSGTLTVKRTAQEDVGAVVLGILGQKVKEIRGITDATNVLFGAFAGTPAALSGTFTVDKGIVHTSDTKIDGRQATALTQGDIDLPAWQINTRTDVFRAEDTATPYLTAELRGPLDKPNPRISGQPFQRQQQPPAQAPTDTQAPAAPATPAAPVKPEDILKKGLKDLLKGLPQ
jgi:uncharacterized protein involved in outer membrane biogenesis